MWVFLHTVIIYVFTIGSTFIFAVTAILVSFFSRTGNSVHHVGRTWGRSLLWIARVKVKVYGLEHIDPGRSAIYMSNHQSNFDIPVFYGALPVQFRWLAKAELFKIPIFGRSMKGAGYISVDRSDRKSAMRSLLRAAQTIRNGTSVLVFPEGTRSADGAVLPFKPGGFVLAMNAGVPIIPMAVQGTNFVMAKGRKLIRGRCVSITIRPAIDTTAYSRREKKELMEHVRTVIMDASLEASSREEACLN